VLDFFLGGFSTAIVAKGLGRNSAGFEINPNAFENGKTQWGRTGWNSLINSFPVGTDDKPSMYGKPLSSDERQSIVNHVSTRVGAGASKETAIRGAMEEFGRGYWSITKLLKAELEERMKKASLY